MLSQLKKSDFSYELPPELIAQRPLTQRGAARLLVLGAQQAQHARLRDLPDLVAPQDLLVVNDTKVVKARLHGRKASGGAAEFLLERLLDTQTALCQLKVSKAVAVGGLVSFGSYSAEVLGREGRFYRVRFDAPVEQVLDELGEVPLPPYIDRAADAADDSDYQTVFASTPGAVAAPTAGLHFDAELLSAFAAKGVAQARVTLHVGAGTFTPVRAERLVEHQMHAERFFVPAATRQAIAACRARGGRVIAVGTTVVRALESDALLAADCLGEQVISSEQTQLFITPGFTFRAVDALLTNFHLPESTLLMLVSAFGTREAFLAAYREAVNKRYRFFSYGDAMFIPACWAQSAAADGALSSSHQTEVPR